MGNSNQEFTDKFKTNKQLDLKTDTAFFALNIKSCNI
jgi:hypothetical protein